MRPPTPPPTPLAIVSKLDRFKAAVLVAFKDVLGAIKLVCTTRSVDVVSEDVTRDVDWNRLNQ